ncbi:MAG: GNAT family N-acetyltransferase [Anaerolineales bacterium]|nr:GNAT family N-acetyltransferase [Anaerolineales bacterium]
MTTFSFKSALSFSIPEIAALFTRGFEGYFVPVQMTDVALQTMIRRDGVDLAESRILFKDDEPIGVALIARRGWTSRLAAMGIVTEARNGGIGTWAMKQLIEEARARAEKEMFLEVIEQNTAGVKLYQKVGFETVRRLVGYKLENPQGKSKGKLEEIDIRDLAKLISAHGLKDLPWQLSGETIAQHTPPSRAYRLDDAYCLISNPEAEQVVISSVLVKAGSRGAGLSPVLMRAVFSRFPNKTWRVPAIFPEEMSPIFEEVGMKREELSQLQMALTL